MNNLYRFRKSIIAAVVCASIALLFSVSAYAQEEVSDSAEDEAYAYSEQITRFHSDITVHHDASITVTEQITYDFGALQRHGIIRVIPLYYTTDQGSFSLPLQVLSVTDAQGNAQPYTLYVGSTTEITIGSADTTVTGEQTYHITYTMDNVVSGFADGDTLQWDVTGTEWGVGISEASATVYMEDGQEIRDSSCYTGSEYSTDQWCETRIDGSTAYIKTNFSLLSFQGLTLYVTVPHGTIDTPAMLSLASADDADARARSVTFFLNRTDATVYEEVSEYTTAEQYTPSLLRIDAGTYALKGERFGFVPQRHTLVLAPGEEREFVFTLEPTWWKPWVDMYIPIGLMVVATLCAAAWWFKRGRDPKGKGTIIPQYEPPKGIYPSVAGVIVDQRAHMHDVSASIVYLAVRGYLQIHMESKNEYTLIKKKPILVSSMDVGEFEKRIFALLFTNRSECSMLELEHAFANTLGDLKNELYAAATTGGFFARNPEKVRILYSIIAVGTTIIVWLAGIMAYQTLYSMWYLLLACVITIDLWILIFVMPKTTRKGSEMVEYMEGMKLFIRTAEQARICALYTPEKYSGAFEALLPYAMVLELEEEWAELFESLFVPQPTWMDGQQFSSTAVLAHSLIAFHHTVERHMQPQASATGAGSRGSHWASSISSGGGGGFSGGGFGGGGGSSW